jgi:hypothetical protein
LIGLILFFIPIFIALKKDRPDKLAIITVNIIFAIYATWIGGITPLIWIATMVWWLSKPAPKTGNTVKQEALSQNTKNSTPKVNSKASIALNVVCQVILGTLAAACAVGAFICGIKAPKKTDGEKWIESESAWGKKDAGLFNDDD